MGVIAANAKHLSLAMLVLQNTCLVLLMRQSLVTDGQRYATSTAVALMEMLKLTACLGVVYLESGEMRTFSKKLRAEVLKQPREIAKLMVPALLYTVQNNLLYIALEHLDAATYSVCYQTKILTTALFSVVLLRRKLTWSKWGALILLTIGVALTEVSDSSENDGRDTSGETSPILGFTCVLAAACTSGFSGVYFEMILKGSKTSLWIRNIQMGVPSIVIALVSVLCKDWEQVSTNGFFHGYNAVVVGVVLLQAIGGLVVAVVVKYADNIRKSFAAAVSIVISCIMSSVLFDFHPNRVFVLGASCVCGSVFIYSRPTTSKGLPTFHKSTLTGAVSDLDRRRSFSRRK